MGVGRLPLLIVFLSNLLIEASLFASSFQNLTLSFTRACAAKVFNVGNILLGSGSLVGCLIDCSIFSAANWTSDLGLVNFGCIVCSSLLADNSVSDFGLNLAGITALALTDKPSCDLAESRSNNISINRLFESFDNLSRLILLFV